MKRNILLFIVLITNIVISQNNIKLNIHHKLGSADFQFNSIVSNNLGHSFKLTRLQYYLTKFSLVHDGGQLTEISNDVVVLVNAGEGVTTIDFGLQHVNQIEAIKFHVGVFDPVNHQDPSALPSAHPLAPKAPSMHWGWTSGYRFIALEGKSGSNLNQTLELHALGDVNYTELSVQSSGVLDLGNVDIHINADYRRSLENIAIGSGLTIHGEKFEVVDMMLNFRDFVFTSGVQSLSNLYLPFEDFEIHPNPSEGFISIKTSSVAANLEIDVVDVTGRLIMNTQLMNLDIKNTLVIDVPGVYMISLKSNNLVLSTKRVVIE